MTGSETEAATTRKTKGRNGGNRATPKTSDKQHSTAIASHLKATIVRLALWGMLPFKLAEWLIRLGGLRDA